MAQVVHKAGLGAHLSLIVASVLVAWVIDLLIRLLEGNIDILAKHHVISGFRLFKLAMCTSYVIMTFVRRRTPFRYNPEWLFRLSGLTLDLMATAAVASIRFRSIPDECWATFWAVVLGCLFWNCFAFVVLSPRMFPKYNKMQGMVCIGDSLGHSWVGLLFCRAVDPDLATPVPLAYAYKTMLFFIPASGGKNAIVIGLIDLFGLWRTLIACLLALCFWFYVFHLVKAQFPQHHKAAHGNSAADPARKTKKRKGAGREGGRGLEDGESEEVEDAVELLPMMSASPEPSARKRLELSPSTSEGDRGGDVPGPRVALSEESEILKPVHVKELQCHLPGIDAMRDRWNLVYSTGRDGASLETLIWKCQEHHADTCILIMEDSYGYRFGAYIDGRIREDHQYYGTGQSFVFTFNPSFKAYEWTGQNDYFMLTTHKFLALGGGGAGFALQVDDELDRGQSCRSGTYDNDCLASSEFFRVSALEVWSFPGLSASL